MKIIPLKEKVEEASKQLHQYQSGDLKPIKTGREWLDEIFGGLIPGDIVTIAGSSGGGKTYEAQSLKNYIMDPANNEDAGDYVWLDNALEMKFLSTVIRDLHKLLKKSKKSILTQLFNKKEQEISKKWSKNLKDGRFYINEETDDPRSFKKGCREFLSQHTNKRAVFISVDHMALQKGEKNEIDEIVGGMKELSKEFPNVIWIPISQLNREILKRIREKDNMAMPDRGDLYQTDTIFHISDYLYIVHNPYRLGIHQYLKVNSEVYSYLSDHFGEKTKDRVSFLTFSRIFYHVLKARENNFIFKDIYIQQIEFEGKEKFMAFNEPEEEVEEEEHVPYIGDGDEPPF